MSTNTPPIVPTDERLARLAARSAAHRATRTAAGPGLPLAPPVYGGAPVLTATARAPRRRHPARGSRAMALALSVGTTVGLAGWFKALDDDPGTLAAGGAISGGALAASGAGTSPAATPATARPATVTPATATPATATSATATSATAAAATAAAATTRATTATTVAASAAGAGLANGTWTGAASSTRWGPVQVAVTVASGRISAVNVLQFPNRDNKSVGINNRALPTLVSETMTAQSARIDSVSGATYTSASYRASLQSALDAARAATAASA